jgi:hypothetical protein
MHFSVLPAVFVNQRRNDFEQWRQNNSHQAEVKRAEGRIASSPASLEGAPIALRSSGGGSGTNRLARSSAGEVTNVEAVFTSACEAAEEEEYVWSLSPMRRSR